ncbi:type I-B CRISPR-associated protein Cas5b [Thermodesulfovibrio yellowstonii]|uniref:Type I-B CRISPR-associated protein Cas5 n=1 Tax=Thermodesulfovibrio yellowstonii TaxID=28262 RepID=A0A9W6LJE5_9BACT|nr:type I-B CRISPR-associated protein Cas5b [Thermodesulfovibrio islandicus]GLI52444.1 hypothetical protein TISLANDTSLP1_01370 [Thermodesulfovibrio islandicus]
MIKQVLKVKIYQPDAHYRIPFSFQRRFTYPIPPFSTVKGLICNIIGIRDDNDTRLNKIRDGLSLAIYGRYETLVKEYTWFRNLEKDSHKNRFHTAENRHLDGVPQHPGGQIPVTVDVLHNVNLLIYFYHPDNKFLQDIKNAFQNPSDRSSILHLGRAEDWLVINEIKLVELKRKFARQIPYFAWIPARDFVDNSFIVEAYEDFFNSLDGNLFRLPTFYDISNNQRIFNDYVNVKLHEGGSFKRYVFFVDESENDLPIILSKLRGS